MSDISSNDNIQKIVSGEQELSYCAHCGKEATYYDGVLCSNPNCVLNQETIIPMTIEEWESRPLEDALQAKLNACESVLSDAELMRNAADVYVDELKDKLDYAKEILMQIMESKDIFKTFMIAKEAQKKLGE